MTGSPGAEVTEMWTILTSASLLRYWKVCLFSLDVLSFQGNLKTCIFVCRFSIFIHSANFVFPWNSVKINCAVCWPNLTPSVDICLRFYITLTVNVSPSERSHCSQTVSWLTLWKQALKTWEGAWKDFQVLSSLRTHKESPFLSLLLQRTAT